MSQSNLIPNRRVTDRQTIRHSYGLQPLSPEKFIRALEDIIARRTNLITAGQFQQYLFKQLILPTGVPNDN